MGNAPPFPAIVIAGMHRSGTSLTASLVASAGVHLGERLVGPERGNPKGHFEDIDFYELHRQTLAANGLGTEGFTCEETIAVPPAVGDAFDALVARRRGLGQPWGWKDPRTTLFLDAWRERLPEAVFLLLFRRPWEVVDSLLRRGDAAFAANPRLAADVWLAYNRRLHAFFLAHRDRCLLVETTSVARDPAGMIAEVGRLMGVPLGSPEDRYDPALLVEDASFDRQSLVRGMRPEATTLYESLRRLAACDTANAPSRDGPQPVAAATRLDDPRGDLIDAAAMQWVRAAKADELARRRDEELTATGQQLAATSRQLSATVAERDGLAGELERRTAELVADRDATMARLVAADLEVVALREQLAWARRRKTFRERLSLESRRIVRQAVGVFQGLRTNRQPRGV